MQGHLPGPPSPHVPLGLAPVIGYMATREPQPLEERTPEHPEWWEDEVEEWAPLRPRGIKVMAVVMALAIALAGLSTVLELVLTSH